MSERLTEAEIEVIAERAAEKAIQKVYSDIGKSVAQKIFWFVGVAVIAGLAVLAGKDLSVK